ncbi:hypothetical protein BU26DRAFT_554549 [Trematosphaeria pertusa]|uniref:Uncharacterized protein n=1 Tax=Trematosphaeria pertusa TaxID=390896 RepID=A0A6A6I0M5_9PLEO|nr:uncharacterized protein BU26DRAFT_554549 [Trematosphaeria pertusa]KAF2243699.1 hypothetical protein BU26DRAFT_554549 [Trematosphaeria pertusa]
MPVLGYVDIWMRSRLSSWSNAIHRPYGSRGWPSPPIPHRLILFSTVTQPAPADLDRQRPASGACTYQRLLPTGPLHARQQTDPRQPSALAILPAYTLRVAQARNTTLLPASPLANTLLRCSERHVLKRRATPLKRRRPRARGDWLTGARSEIASAPCKQLAGSESTAGCLETRLLWGRCTSSSHLAQASEDSQLTAWPELLLPRTQAKRRRRGRSIGSGPAASQARYSPPAFLRAASKVASLCVPPRGPQDKYHASSRIHSFSVSAVRFDISSLLPFIPLLPPSLEPAGTIPPPLAGQSRASTPPSPSWQCHSQTLLAVCPVALPFPSQQHCAFRRPESIPLNSHRSFVSTSSVSALSSHLVQPRTQLTHAWTARHTLLILSFRLAGLILIRGARYSYFGTDTSAIYTAEAPVL